MFSIKDGFIGALWAKKYLWLLWNNRICYTGKYLTFAGNFVNLSPHFLHINTALTILQFSQYTRLVQVIHQTKFGPFWSYFRFFNENWQKRPKIFCSKQKIAFLSFSLQNIALKQPVQYSLDTNRYWETISVENDRIFVKKLDFLN